MIFMIIFQVRYLDLLFNEAIEWNELLTSQRFAPSLVLEFPVTLAFLHRSTKACQRC